MCADGGNAAGLLQLRSLKAWGLPSGALSHLQRFSALTSLSMARLTNHTGYAHTSSEVDIEQARAALAGLTSLQGVPDLHRVLLAAVLDVLSMLCMERKTHLLMLLLMMTMLYCCIDALYVQCHAPERHHHHSI
jgi:hypothetical protein